MIVVLMLDVYSRAAPRANLEHRAGYFGNVSDEELWTILAELRGIIERHKHLSPTMDYVSQEAEDRARVLEGGKNGHL
jgi:hypothetical protein